MGHRAFSRGTPTTEDTDTSAIARANGSGAPSPRLADGGGGRTLPTKRAYPPASVARKYDTSACMSRKRRCRTAAGHAKNKIIPDVSRDTMWNWPDPTAYHTSETDA